MIYPQKFSITALIRSLIIIKVAIITNIPAPYRELVYENLSKYKEIELVLFYAAKIDHIRKWDIKLGNYKNFFLNCKYILLKNKPIYYGSNIISRLNRLKPDVVITTGFSPLYIKSFLWTILNNKKHIPFSDGWKLSEQDLSILHKVLRMIIYKYSSAFIGASLKALSNYESYGIKTEELFQSHLCIDNNYFEKYINNNKEYDIIFSGQFIDRKLPFFFVKVCQILNANLSNFKVLIIGDGPLKTKLFHEMSKNKIRFNYPGFIKQSSLGQYYSNAKLLLFPTKVDP